MPNDRALATPSGEERELALVRAISPEACLKSLPADARGYLQITVPDWVVPGEDLQKFFSQYNQLWAGGRVVWAHIVQANNNLFSDNPVNAPGEVIYDPTGKTGPLELGGYARALFKLKGTKPEEPSLRRIADHLTDEMTRAYGFPVSQTISRRFLLLSTTYFYRKHLLTKKC